MICKTTPSTQNKVIKNYIIYIYTVFDLVYFSDISNHNFKNKWQQYLEF